MGNTVICRLARRLALMTALAAAAFVFITSTTGAGALLDSRTITTAIAHP
jgi:hypothetical protein